MKRVLVAVFMVVALAACKRDVIIQDMVDQPIVRYDDRELSLEQLEKAIAMAGAERGWAMQSVAPGHMVGILEAGGGKHRAVVDVHYDSNTYSITYKDSNNLRYQAPNKIHRRYNGWVANLARSINTNIQRIN